MKKHYKNHLLAFIICFVAAGIIGVVIGTINYFGPRRSTTQASASVTLSYDGVSSGLAPNGEKFNMSSFYDEELMAKALEECGLSGKYQPDQVMKSLTIRGSYDKDVVKKILSYESLLEFTANKEMSVSNVFPTCFTVTITNTFDETVSQKDLESILGSLMKVYDSHFATTYMFAFDTGMYGNSVSLDDFDFEQQIQLISSDLNLVNGYAMEMYEKAPAFRHNGIGFNDIYVQNNAIKTSLVDKINALTTMNSYSKVPGRLYIQYVYQLNSLANEVDQYEKNLSELDELIATYDKYEIVYVAAGDGLTKLDGNSSETYDALVDMRMELSDKITADRTLMIDYERKLEDLRKSLGISEEAAVTPAPLFVSQEEADVEAEENTDGTAVTSENLISANGSDNDSLITSKRWTIEEGWEKFEIDEASLSGLVDDISELVMQREAVNEQFAELITAYNETFLSGADFAGAKIRYTAPKLLSGGYIMSLIKACGPFCMLVIIIWTAVCFFENSKKKEEI